MFNSVGVRGQKRLYKENILRKGEKVLQAEGTAEQRLRSEEQH